MAVEGREQVTRIGIVRVNGRPEELDGPDGRRQPSLGGTSRVSREAQARICERLGVKFPGATRPGARRALFVRSPASRIGRNGGHLEVSAITRPTDARGSNIRDARSARGEIARQLACRDRNSARRRRSGCARSDRSQAADGAARHRGSRGHARQHSALDRKGRVKSTESKTYEVMELYGSQVRRLVAKDESAFRRGCLEPIDADSPPACSRRPGGVFGARVKGGRRGLRAPWPSRASPRLHALAGREQAGRYAILCTSVLRATRKILLLGTYNFPVETAPGHWPACHLAIRNPLRIGPEATRKIAGRPPDAPGPFSCCSPAACRRKCATRRSS